MAYFHTNVLDNQIKALPTVSTASGSVATFDTDMTENLIECVCDIQYSQAEGTPTPDNPIPITVYNALNLSHSGADTSNPTIINIPFGQTVAKGTLNVLSGKLEVDLVTLDLGSITWTIVDNSMGLVRVTAFNNAVACDAYPFSDLAFEQMPDKSCRNYVNWFYVKDSSLIDKTATEVKNYMSGFTVIKPPATPTTVQLDSNQVQALLNENNIWCDTNGDTEVKYLLTVGKKIS